MRLVVQPSGAKSWAFRYEPGGRAVKMTLGPAVGPGALSLAEAREQAGEARKSLTAGTDPAAARKAAREAEAARIEAEKKAAAAAARRDDDVIENLIDRYIARHVVVKMRSAHEVRRLLEKEVKAPWRGRLVTEISPKDVLKLMDGIAERGAGTTANRTLANLRAFFNWAIKRHILDESPCRRVEAPKKEVSRDRVLTDDEIRVLALAIVRLDWPWRQFFALALLTGQRREEVAGMRWSEIDLSAREPVWSLPKERTKNGRAHAVALVPAAVDVLRTVPRIKDSEFVLTTTGETSVSGFSRAKQTLDEKMREIAREEALARGEPPERLALAPWRLHDLRRTAASGMAGLGVSVATVEKVLNHASGTFAGIVGVYQR